jgi:hypothetical protein
VSLTYLGADISSRADVESAVDFVMQPLLPASSRSIISTTTDIALTPPLYVDDLHDQHFLFQINPALSDTAKSILDLSSTIEHALRFQLPLDPDLLDKEVIFIQRSLLVCDTSAFTAFEKAFRFAAMIYVKSLTRPIANIARTSQILTAKLHTELMLVKEEPTPLLRWIHFMGFMASLKTSSKRLSFLEGLPIRDWHETREDLAKVLWVDQIHDSFSEELWLSI